MMAGEKPKQILCDLCEDEEATTFCDECQSKVCEFCKIAHATLKRTKNHNIADIDQVKLSVLNVCCSLCDGQADKFCPDCNVCLCKACAESHHKLDNNTASDKSETTLDSSQILDDDSTPTPSALDVTDVNKHYDVLCDLCEEERAGSFCEDCQSKLGDFCEASHKKQKATKCHNITPIQLTELNKRHSKCSICDDRAGTFCTECNVHLCTKCSNDHHKLSDTLTPGKKIINTNQGIEEPLVEERMPDKNQIHGSRSSLVRVEPKIRPDKSSMCKSELSTDKTRTSSSNVDPSNGQNIEEDRPGKPTVESILADSVSMVWNAMNNFCEGDMYEVRIENRQTGTWSEKLFETNRGIIEGLQQGSPYVFKVRIAKANGKASKYSENSEKVILKKETKKEENSCDIEKTPHIAAQLDTSEKTMNEDNQSSENKQKPNEHEGTSEEIASQSGCSEVENRADFQVTHEKSVPSTRHNNWYTSMLTLKYLQPALFPVVQDKISSVHDETVSLFERQVCAEATANDIEKCARNTAKFKHTCPTDQKYSYTCQKLLNIIKSHTSDSVDFFNMLKGTDPQKWIKTPLDYVRLFLQKWMRCGIEDFKDCDISALCDIITRFKPLMQMFDDEKIAAVRRVRNTTMHCAQMVLSQQDMEEHIEIILDFLNHMKSLKSTDDVKNAIDCINQLRTGNVSFLHELVVELITGCLPGVIKEYAHTQDKANRLREIISYMQKELDRLSSGVENAESIHKGREAVLEAKADRPGKPYVKEIYTDSVDIFWDSDQQFQKGDRYQVRLETVPKETWGLQTYEINNVKITGLKPNTSYLFKVRWVKSNGEESTYSEESDIITTTMPFASTILGESKLVKKCSGELDVYQLPLDELLDARNEPANSKKFDIGPRDMNVIEEKTIMLVGATGSGKSTFVNLLANYVLGVRLDDPFRFTVMKEDDRAIQKDEAQSQTDAISCYSFNKQAGTRLKFRINVIDTPGFGAIGGTERDKKTVEQILQLFEATGTKGIQTIDAVCFFLKATEARLAEVQRISKVILSMFSQDIKENICAITTFADGSEPKVIAALEAEKITFDNIFYFNNSALFSDPMNNPLTSMFWNMGFQSLDELFKHINKLKPKISYRGEAST